MPVALILVVGQDQLILETRCAILRSAGYTVRSASSIRESIDLFHAGDFDLIVLCHSVCAEDRDRITLVIRSNGSRIPILTVASASTDFREGLADGTLSSRPQDLIKGLTDLLADDPHKTAQTVCQ